MVNLKIKRNPENLTFFLNFENSKNEKFRDTIAKTHQKSEFFGYAIKSSGIYSSPRQSKGTNFDEWCERISLMEINFEREFNSSTDALNFYTSTNPSHSKYALQEFMDAIQDYKEYKKEFDDASEISADSARRFLLILPMLASRKPKIYIDAKNGCFNVDMQTSDNGVLSIQVSDNGQIYYSYVAQYNRIYKITGTAKFKDFKDFLKFNKVLQML